MKTLSVLLTSLILLVPIAVSAADSPAFTRVPPVLVDDEQILIFQYFLYRQIILYFDRHE